MEHGIGMPRYFYSENDREGWQPDTINSRLNAALAVQVVRVALRPSTSLIQARTLRV